MATFTFQFQLNMKIILIETSIKEVSAQLPSIMSISNWHCALLKCQTISVQMVRFGAQCRIEFTNITKLGYNKKPVMEDSLNYSRALMVNYGNYLLYFKFTKNQMAIYTTKLDTSTRVLNRLNQYNRYR